MIEGLYEVCIGTPDPILQIQYWLQFGYRIGSMGALAMEQSQALYGVDSTLQSIRLYHQNADHGLIRLMVWQKPLNEGLGLSSMRAKGNRWATTMTADLLQIANHAEVAQSVGSPLRVSAPHWEVIYQKKSIQQPFVDVMVGVREMLLLQPLTRQMLFQRFGYEVPNYGTIHEASPFKSSQITHAGLVIQDDTKETLRFYDEVLGLLRSRDDVETTYASSAAGRDFFELAPGERFWVTAFDDPRSSATQFQAARSGRLYVLRFPESMVLESRFEASRPGCLGLSLYTYRVQGLEDYRFRLQHSAAQSITPIIANEFGESSFSFVSPDGYVWTLIGDKA